MQFQWYEFALTDKKDPWTAIFCSADRQPQFNIMRKRFRLKHDAGNFLYQNDFWIGNGIDIHYPAIKTQLSTNLYFFEADYGDKKPKTRIWALVKITQHLADVPDDIVAECIQASRRKKIKELSNRKEG